MVCCLTAQSHYPDQCWLKIGEVFWHSPKSKFTGNAQDLYKWVKPTSNDVGYKCEQIWKERCGMKAYIIINRTTWWFETPSHSLWRYRNDTRAILSSRNIKHATRSATCPIQFSWRRHQMETFSALLALCKGNHSPRKGQWCGALMFSLICAWTHDWANNRDAGHRTQYDFTVMGS